MWIIKSYLLYILYKITLKESKMFFSSSTCMVCAICCKHGGSNHYYLALVLKIEEKAQNRTEHSES